MDPFWGSGPLPAKAFEDLVVWQMQLMGNLQMTIFSETFPVQGVTQDKLILKYHVLKF